MDAIELARAIKSLKPEAEFAFDDADYSTIRWVKLEGDAPSFEELSAESDKLKKQDVAIAKQAATKRAALLERLGITEEEAKLLLS